MATAEFSKFAGLFKEHTAGIEGTYFNIVKAIVTNPQLISYSGEKLKAFPLKSGIRLIQYS